MKGIIDTLLLLALPASGKSEVRRYLASLDPDACRAEFGLGPTVQLDDFPYVHLMRRIDDEMETLGRQRLFFHAPDRGFREGRDWGTLVELVNQDHAALRSPPTATGAASPERFLARLDEAAAAVGIRPRLAALDGKTREALAGRLRQDVLGLERDLAAARGESLDGRTVVIEFARGGPEGSAMPLPAPYGYAYSVGRLSAEILQRAAVLYVWVTPEESRRKNLERADPNDPGSILHHGVPEAVMRGDYGCDDMDWLVAQSDRPGTIRIEAHGRTFHLPLGRFDNRVDRTSFVRGDHETWASADVQALRDGLKSAFDALRGA